MRHVQFQQKYVYCNQRSGEGSVCFPIGKVATPPSGDPANFFCITYLLFHSGNNRVPPFIESWMEAEDSAAAMKTWSDEKLAMEQENIIQKWGWGEI